jgi:hypothetical protein
MSRPFTEIDLPTPPMGAKCFLLEGKGLFLLQRGPCVLRAIACTHAGSGSLIAYDGMPDDEGFFPEEIVGDAELPTSPVERAQRARDLPGQSDGHGHVAARRRLPARADAARRRWDRKHFGHRQRRVDALQSQAARRGSRAATDRRARVTPLSEMSAREPIDLYAPASPGALMRVQRIDRPGLWRLARRDCELYSVMIVSSGSWGRARALDGQGRVLWFQPSTFTGSFVLGAGALGGLIIELDSQDMAANLTINYREIDQQIL